MRRFGVLQALCLQARKALSLDRLDGGVVRFGRLGVLHFHLFDGGLQLVVALD